MPSSLPYCSTGRMGVPALQPTWPNSACLSTLCSIHSSSINRSHQGVNALLRLYDDRQRSLYIKALRMLLDRILAQLPRRHWSMDPGSCPPHCQPLIDVIKAVHKACILQGNDGACVVIRMQQQLQYDSGTRS